MVLPLRDGGADSAAPTVPCAAADSRPASEPSTAAAAAAANGARAASLFLLAEADDDDASGAVWLEESAEEVEDEEEDNSVDASNTWVRLIVTAAQAAESIVSGDEFPLEEGAVYYENVESGATLWTPPPDGIIADASNVAYRWWFDEGGEASRG